MLLLAKVFAAVVFKTFRCYNENYKKNTRNIQQNKREEIKKEKNKDRKEKQNKKNLISKFYVLH